MDGPRDERDFKAELEIKTPAWLPVFRVTTSFQRMWEKRGADYANRTAEFAGIDTDELEHELNQGGPIADLFLVGARRVVEDGDEVLCDAVTRLVAAALRDCALIHDASYLMKKLSNCEALHIRAICAIPHSRQLPPTPDEESIRSAINKDTWPPADTMFHEWHDGIFMFSLESIAETCRASKSLVRAALGELISIGFVEVIDLVSEMGSGEVKLMYYGILSQIPHHNLYRLTELGADFRDLILTIDAQGRTPDTH